MRHLLINDKDITWYAYVAKYSCIYLNYNILSFDLYTIYRSSTSLTCQVHNNKMKYQPYRAAMNKHHKHTIKQINKQFRFS